QTVRVLRLDEEAIVSVPDVVWDPAHPGRDHGATRRHGLDQDTRHALRARREYHDAAACHQRRDLVRHDRSGESDAWIVLVEIPILLLLGKVAHQTELPAGELRAACVEGAK